MRNGEPYDAFRQTLYDNGQTDKILDRLKTRYDRIFKRAFTIACSEYLEKLFDDVGFRRSLEGYKTLLRAVRLYCSVKPAELSKLTFSQVVTVLETEFDGARRWIEKQMQYVITDAYKTKKIYNLDKYSLCAPLSKRKSHLTVVEFAAEVRSLLIFKAMRETQF